MRYLNIMANISLAWIGVLTEDILASLKSGKKSMCVSLDFA